MATMMSGSPSPSMTRCPSCGAELDFSTIGNHVCPLGTPMHSSKPGTPVMDRYNNAPPLGMGPHRNAPLGGKLPKFAPPARIDPFAANEAFLQPPQTAPGFQTEAGPGSPAALGSPVSSRFRMPPRSATTPHFRERSRSPEMRMPQDSAFPIFPTKKIREKEAKKDRQRSKSMSRSQSRDRGAIRAALGSNNQSSSRAASPALTPFPQRPATANSNSRKNSFSSLRSPGGDQAPFGGPLEPIPPLPAHQDANGRGSPRLEGQHNGPVEPPNSVSSPLIGSPLTPALERQPSESSMHFKQQNASAAIRPLDAIGSNRKTSPELGFGIPRSQSATGHGTSPHVNDTPTLPNLQPATTERNPPDWASHPPASPAVPDALAIKFPPRSASKEHHEEQESHEDGLGKLPSFKPLEHGIQGLPNRTRTSASSDGSSYSATHSISSRSSPPTSASSFTMHDNAPKGDNPESAPRESAEGVRPSLTAEPTIPVVAATPSSAPPQQRTRGPAKSFSRPNYARPQLDTQAAINASQAAPSPRFGPNGPMTPATASQGRPPPSVLDGRPPISDLRSPPTDFRSPSSITPSDRPFSPMSPRTLPTPVSARGGEQGFQPPLRRPTTPGFKGKCRGCGEMIVGKSVCSADGRLTGRYHKHCFVCQTCKEPFQTADFYVINNQPYCQRHYHTLNGSLCTSCDRGIEGPYMETDAEKKFHPHCFTCKECHLILRNDYFEVNGVIYCEKHSRKPDLLGPGRRFPERRTTRLMMM